MSLTGKSPGTVVLLAWRVGRRAFDDYPCRFASRVYTQPRRFACPVLETFFGTD